MKQFFLVVSVLLLAGCGAPNAPLPSGQRMPINADQAATFVKSEHLVFHNDPDDEIYQRD